MFFGVLLRKPVLNFHRLFLGVNKSESKKSDVNGSATSVLSSQQQSFQSTNNTSVVQSIGSAAGSGDDKDQSQSTSTHESGPTMLGQMISEAKSPSNSIMPLVTMYSGNPNTQTPTPTVATSTSSVEPPLIDSSVGEDSDKTIPLTPIAQCSVDSSKITSVSKPEEQTEQNVTPQLDESVNPPQVDVDSSKITSVSQPDEQLEPNVTPQLDEGVNPPETDAANIVIEEERRTDVVLPMKVGVNFQ